jgi:hypothetical protein
MRPLSKLCACLLLNLNFSMLFAQDKIDYFKVPQEVMERFSNENLLDKYEFSGRMNPFYLRGDFDGDGRADYALLVRNKNSNSEELAVVLSKSKRTFFFVHKENPWPFDGWEVQAKDKVEANLSGERPPRLIGDGIFVKYKGPGVLLYWKGHSFGRYVQGE